MDAQFYTSPEWRALSERVRERDSNRCTVAALLGGDCHGLLHAHHLDVDGDPLDITNCGSVCAAHHPTWESLRRAVVERRTRQRRCTHRHPYRGGREACERRLNAVA